MNKTYITPRLRVCDLAGETIIAASDFEVNTDGSTTVSPGEGGVIPSESRENKSLWDAEW